MARPISNSNDQAATLRNLKVLVVLLVVSNILVGVLGVYLLRSVDQRYTELFDQTVPVLNNLRELMGDTVAAMRSTSPIVFTGPGATRPGALSAMDRALATQQVFQARLLSSDLRTEPAMAEALRKTGEEFKQNFAEVTRLYAAGQDREAIQLRDDKLRPAFDRHLALISKSAEAIETTSRGVSDNYTVRTNRLSTIVLGVASWPVILLFGLLLLTAVFVIAMMIAFRGKDLANMP